MKSVILSIVLILCVAVVGKAQFDNIDIAGEGRIPLLAGWAVADNGGDYPYRIMHVDEDAELLVFKSTVTEDQRITDNESLKRSVDKVIADVILTLPKGKLLSNTGYFEDNRLLFELDFQSFDSTDQETMNHRLVGIIYQHPDGHQILFTLWGKAYESVSPAVFDEIRLMQDHFTYFGESTDKIYQAEEHPWYWIAGLLLLIVAVLMIFNRKKNVNRVAFTGESHFWRCDCGRQNYIDQDSCKRCGRQKKEPVISK